MGSQHPRPTLPRILLVFGTRPEAIKLAPLIRVLREPSSHLDVRVCVTAQHRGMLDQVLDLFEICPDCDLDLMRPGQSLAGSAAAILAGLAPVIEQERPDYVLVQGDTTTAFCASLAAFYASVPVGHVEAGLRTGDLHAPFPEEMNRVLAGRLATLHFAPTERARQNLLGEGVADENITVTGNTGIDAVLATRDLLEAGSATPPICPEIDPSKRILLVTAHRRESFGPSFESVCRALARLGRRGDVEVVYPVHPNPNVREPVERVLANAPGVRLLDPLDYLSFVDLMRRSFAILTDSGGIQEEAPSLGKPVIVLRDTTERPEAVEAGTAVLAGTAEDRIVAEAERLLDDPAEYRRRSLVHNPFGDGDASKRILQTLLSSLFSAT